MTVDTSKTLEQLDGQQWGPPTFGSYVVTACHRLHRVPLNRFRAEDFRVMLGQRMSLEFIVPAAITYLQDCPLAAGDYHPGDMLENLLRIPAEFWAKHAELRATTAMLTQRAFTMIPDLDEDYRAFAREHLTSAYANFQGHS